MTSEGTVLFSFRLRTTDSEKCSPEMTGGHRWASAGGVWAGHDRNVQRASRRRSCSREHPLADADGVGRDLDQLVVGDELDGRLERVDRWAASA